MNEEIKKKILDHFGKKIEIARFLNVSRQQVNHWFNGNQLVDVKSALRLADALGIDWLDIREDMRL